MTITCPVCGNAGEPSAQVGRVAICMACGASLILKDDGQAIRATGADTTKLGPAELTALRKARGRVR
jgi:hypothetical protein